MEGPGIWVEKSPLSLGRFWEGGEGRSEALEAREAYQAGKQRGKRLFPCFLKP
jgi:hypothetical protein